MIDSLLDLFTTTTVDVTAGSYVWSILAALLMGIGFSYAAQFRNFVSKSFSVTLALLPAVVSVVIMMVNGSIGTGIAVAGAFSLVRFRSVPGTAREILAVFIAMAIGLACGMVNITYALIFTMVISAALLILENTSFGEPKQMSKHKIIRITIPEDLDYTEIFQDLFEQYTSAHQLVSTKTTNLGSMFRLTYTVTLNDPYEEKEFIDQIRVRNGNLEITCSMMTSLNNEL